MEHVRTYIWDLLIPPHIRQDISLEEEHRRLLFILVYSMGISVMFPLGIYHLAIGDFLEAVIDIGSCVVGVACIVLVRPKKDGKFYYRFATIVLLVVYAYFGTVSENEFRVLWLYTFPIPAIFLLGAREGIIQTMILFGVWIIYFQLPPDLMGAASYPAHLKLRFVLSFMLVVIWTYFFDYVRTRYREGMEERNRQLEKTNEALAMTQKIARLGNWVFDVETQKIEWSKEVFRMAGLEGRKDPPTFEEYVNILHPDDVDILNLNLEKALNGESYEVELRHKRPDGDYNYTLTRAKPTVKDGKVTKIQGTVVDLTHLKQVEMALKEEMKQRLQYEEDLKLEIEEREKAEMALRESERQIRLITDNIPAYMAYVDTETLTYRFVNRMFLTAYGKERHEIVGHHIKDIIGRSNYKYALPYIEEAKRGKSASYINTFPLKEGKRWINVHYKPDFDENGKVKALFVLSHDITERMQAEEDLSKAKEEAERANQAKSEFIANMSHEIRTPLNAVTGFSELLSSMVEDEKQKNYLSAIKNAGKNLLTLINDILDLSKIEAGKFEIQYTPVKIKNLLDEVEQIFAIQMSRKNLEFSFGINTSLPSSFMMDEIRLRQILLNIVGNAVKFTDQGYIKVQVEPLGAIDQSRIDLQISIEDTGIGIADTDMDTIFESFKQQHGQNTSLYGGTGLGLTISKRLIEMMNGQISVQSSVDEGSVFKIILNQVEVIADEISKPEQELDVENLWFERGKVLIVDDVESNRRLLEERLKRVNLKVITAGNGREATLICQEYNPDIILMDIRMPVMDGYETARYFRNNKETQHIPIIAITASVEILDLSILREKGFDGFMVKPIETDELFEALLKHLPAPVKQVETPRQRLDLKDYFSSLSAQTIGLLPDLLPMVEDKFLGEWRQFEKRQPIDQVKDFGERLKSFGSEHNLDILTAYGNQLIQSVNCFDIDSMRQTLSEFENILNGLKSLSDKGK